MKLVSIKIQNFRQFHGTHTMHLNTSGASNVIVIHGENGAGKTTLLNAFKWCFYGETDFDSRSDNLLNERAIFEAAEGVRLTMAITVEFENEGMHYTASRESLFKKQSGHKYDQIGDSSFSLTWIDASGVSQNSPNPGTHMKQILPEKMQPYFFFNGERIEKLAHINAAGQVQSAIKNLMNLDIVERAVQHLGGPVIARLRKELRDSSPSDLAEAIEKETAMTEKVEEIRAQIAQIDSNVLDFEEEQRIVNRAFDANAEVAGLNKERVDLELRHDELQGQLTQLRKERREFVSAHGGLAFASGLLRTAGDILDEKRKKGELPFKIKGQFIDDLLARHRCICERPLDPETEPFNAVKAFRGTTTSADVEEAFIQTSGAIAPMRKARDNLFYRLSEFQTRERDLTNDALAKLGQIDEIAAKIGGRECEDIAALEAKRRRLQEDIKQSSTQRGSLSSSVQEWEGKLAELTKERERLSALHARNGVATQRLELGEEVKRVLEALYAAMAEQVRERLSTKVDQTFRAIMRKPYWAEISPTYTLEIYKSVAGEKQLVYEKSTGESQITSLSFVGSIVSLAKERAQAENENFRGGVFPIVMDSPFGALDPDYRQKIADYIPQLAEQVIIMVSASQWKGEVAHQVKHRVARQYTLQYASPTAAGDQQQYEFTEIKEGCYVE